MCCSCFIFELHQCKTKKFSPRSRLQLGGGAKATPQAPGSAAYDSCVACIALGGNCALDSVPAVVTWRKRKTDIAVAGVHVRYPLRVQLIKNINRNSLLDENGRLRRSVSILHHSYRIFVPRFPVLYHKIFCKSFFF